MPANFKNDDDPISVNNTDNLGRSLKNLYQYHFDRLPSPRGTPGLRT